MSDSSITGTDIRTGFVLDAKGQIVPVQYLNFNGLAVFEGCIVLGRTQEMEQVAAHLRANPLLFGPGAQALGLGIKEQHFRWPDKMVPYTIEPTLPQPSRVTDAIEHWHAKTDIRLRPKAAGDQNWVSFIRGDVCSSSVGMQGGEQYVVVGGNCQTGNIIHEIGHTVGLWHEQGRADRDQFIEVLWQNITPANRFNFNQHIEDGLSLGGYDYESIMHYGERAFSANGQPTIRVKQGGAFTVGQRNGLSPGDLQAVNALYGGA